VSELSTLAAARRQRIPMSFFFFGCDELKTYGFMTHWRIFLKNRSGFSGVTLDDSEDTSMQW
jgi:hypothetical protein